jgi:ElaB/YqjD/DUF883 family membrane-anchored ribosome-binding protein
MGDSPVPSPDPKGIVKMSLVKNVLKIAIVAAVVEGVRRLATKPEVQQKAKELLGKAGDTAGSAASKAADKAGDAAQKAADTAGKAANKAADKAGDAAHAARNKVPV